FAKQLANLAISVSSTNRFSHSCRGLDPIHLTLIHYNIVPGEILGRTFTNLIFVVFELELLRLQAYNA
ncbi:MAG: hypothetical protein M1368_11850, partial [Thaumarchaeota archaeon]|nr:hypothetical protein [Nitrososphaerota archaeon]